MKKLVIGAVVVVVIGVLVVLNLTSDRAKRTEVETATIGRRDITKVVTASGSIRAKRRVNVSASAIGKVTKVAVEEGDRVEKGDFLLQIDPTAYRSTVDQLEAAVRGAEAALELEKAALEKARDDYKRAQQLAQSEFVSDTDLRNARVAVEIAEAKTKSAAESLSQYRANLGKARHELNEVHITAEMAGVITALNVEEGESAIMGTLNNPGTVLLTIADLSEIEAEVLVDETEVVSIEVGQDARVNLDAYPDTSFAGKVTEVGNSALRGQLGMGQESVDFKVVVALLDVIPSVRPGLTASVDITVGEAHDALALPIECLTVRDEDQIGSKRGADKEPSEETDEHVEKPKEIEGVFVVDGGEATFRPVRVGIAGETHFAVVSGLEEGEEVVSGPFKAVGDLRDGDPVKIKKRKER